MEDIISFRLQKDLLDDLDRIARKKYKQRSEVLREAVVEYVGSNSGKAKRGAHEMGSRTGSRTGSEMGGPSELNGELMHAKITKPKPNKKIKTKKTLISNGMSNGLSNWV